MKKSNILIITSLFLAVTWLMLDGWLQVNAYNKLTTNKSCSYAKIRGGFITQKLQSFKNIKIDVGENLFFISLDIRCKQRNELVYVNEIKDAISYTISGDTLYLKMTNEQSNLFPLVQINLPVLNSVNISWTHNQSLKSKRYGLYTTINDFTGNKLLVKNDCQNNLTLGNDKLKKLELKGDFDNSQIFIMDYTKYDSLDFDINARRPGSMIFSYNLDVPLKINPKQYINIKVPECFRIQAYAGIASKLITKKSPQGSDFRSYSKDLKQEEKDMEIIIEANNSPDYQKQRDLP